MKKKQRKQIRLDSKFLFNLPKTWKELKKQLSSHFDGLTTLGWLSLLIKMFAAVNMMLVNIKLFTSTSQIKVFAFHRMICINLNSTNQPNVNGEVVTMNPECGK